MEPIITSEVVVASSQCSRKAYGLMFSPDQGELHEYVRILEQQRCENQQRYIERLLQKQADIQPYSAGDLRKAGAVFIDARLQTDVFTAVCGVLNRVEGKSAPGKYHYEPTIFTGTYSLSKEQRLELSFVGYVLGRLQNESPVRGRIIGMDERSHTVKLDHTAKNLLPLLESLQEWTTIDSPESPPIVLNKHCAMCQFQKLCQSQAEQEDNLSLLNGITPRVMRQYEKKGIFTVRQLSYLFKPRKRKKRSRKPPPLTHKVELQALAIRENKIYLQELPDLSRKPEELFLDMEGVPDRGLYYLIGLLICQGDTTEHYSFWADTDQDECQIWQQFVDKATQYQDTPIYHYGSYEARAISTLGRRYQTDTKNLTERLVNVNGHLYGKVYFPVRSNGLKDIGTFIGAKWTSPEASGLQSLVWRRRWDTTYQSHYKNMLLIYNAEDCQALKMLTDELSKIKSTADILTEVDFADNPKQNITEKGKLVQSQFEKILIFAHTNYDKRKIKFRQENEKEGINCWEDKATIKNKGLFGHGIKKGYVGHRKVKIKATKTIQVPMRKICPRCENVLLRPTKQECKRLIIDLTLIKNGIKKVIVSYVGVKGHCPKCCKDFLPIEIAKYHKNQLYGDGFKAWLIYQRIALRLPYGNIVRLAEDQFNEKIQPSFIPFCINNAGKRYAKTEKIIIQQIRNSPFIHVDETSINIRGVDEYVWVFTDRKYVFFKKTKTREASLVHEFLDGYNGILISDFYPGYDSVNCKQQKCWVHLIRDLNKDLWSAPFDKEYEVFLLEVRSMFVPIMECVQKYGLKKRNLNKFKKQVNKFYLSAIIDKQYKSELTIKYQKRFIRYRESLFVFLEHNEISWHNNPAENAIRHLAIQRDISPCFSESVIHDYLRLLGINQTCRFHDKSFFKFLLSGEIDIRQFQRTKRLYRV